MLSATPQTETDLQTLSALKRANLFTFVLAGGQSIYLTDFDVDISDPTTGTRYSSAGPYPRYSQMSRKIGVEVDELKVQLWAYQSNQIGSISVLDSIRAQLWTDALVQVRRLWFPPFCPPAKPNLDGRAPLMKWQGNVATVDEVDDIHAEFSCRSRKGKFQRQWPIRIYQPGCGYTLYGPGCELNQNNFTMPGTVESGSGTISLNTSLAAIDHTYDLGTIVFTSGLNSGIRRQIRFYYQASGQATLFLPLPNVPAIGDAFTASRGCAHTQAACATFDNLAHYPGADYVPVPETAV